MGNAYNSKQNEVTRESIITALFILMKKKEFDTISITEIVKKAGVSRMAYYRNYNSKQEVITCYLDNLFMEYIIETSALKNNSEYSQCLLFFSYFRRTNDIIKSIINSDLSHLILKQFDKFIEFLFSNTSADSVPTANHAYYKNIYISGGMYNVLIAWMKGGLKESDNAMAEIMLELYR